MLGVTFLGIVGVRSVSMLIQFDGLRICVCTDMFEIIIA